MMLPTIFQGSVGGLEETSLLRIQGRSLNVGDGEKRSIEFRYVIFDEVATAER